MMNSLSYYLVIGFMGICEGILVNILVDKFPGRQKNSLNEDRSIFLEDNYKNFRRILVLIVYVLFTIAIWRISNDSFELFLNLILLVYLGLVFIIDLEHRVILNSLILVGIILGLFYGIYIHGLVNAVLGGAVGFFVLLVLYYFGKLIMHFLAKLRQIQLDKQAMYRNDVLLGLILGLNLGLSAVINGFLVAFSLLGFAAVFISVYMIAQRKYDPNLSLPLGSFLVLGAVVYISYLFIC